MAGRNRHPYKRVNLAGVNEISIDVEIVELIEGLNYLGWSTDNSCQDNVEGRVWISFHTAYLAEEFLSLIVLRGSEKLSSCVKAATTQMYDKNPTRWKHKDRWWIDCHTRVVPWPRSGIGINISVRFPKNHLAEVTEIISKAADKKRKEVNKRLKEAKVYNGHEAGSS